VVSPFDEFIRIYAVVVILLSVNAFAFRKFNLANFSCESLFSQTLPSPTIF
jgi:hypothetical protein